ncbi:hypothetical protein ACFYTQ_33080 [Nocardia sp. NPDC004068]|uniref:hypothetical protein n=1 Tax=Nocardia sp. NPDC004068 TaxID=3364303 RepID=UPI00369F676D
MTAYRDRAALTQETGLYQWQIDAAEFVGMLPPPEHEQGWTAEQAQQARALAPRIRQRFGAEKPRGATFCADRLADRLGRRVHPDDIRVLAERGHLDVVGTFTPPDSRWEAHAMFAPAQVDRIEVAAAEAALIARVTKVVDTLSENEACEVLGWTGGQLLIAVYTERIRPNLLGRFTRADVEDLAADVEFRERFPGVFG